MYEYLHDVTNQTVYQVPTHPEISEKRDRRGKRTGWTVTMQILITRADNKLNGNQWEHPTSSYPLQHFSAHHEKEQVVSSFLIRHMPAGKRITHEEYVELHAAYQRIAESR